MFKNYLKIAIRNLLRNKVYSLINILGLAVGFTCAILLFLYIQDELNYDNYHKDVAQIFRLEQKISKTDKEKTSVFFQVGLLPNLKRELPEIKHAARVLYSIASLQTEKGEKFFLPSTYYADSAIFQILTYKPIVGDLQKALTKPNGIVLTHAQAIRLYSTPTRALGQSLTLNDDFKLTVTAVIEDAPTNSHLRPRAIVALNVFAKTNPELFKNIAMYSAYVKLAKNTSTNALVKKMSAIFKKYNPQCKDLEVDFRLSAINKIYLNALLKEDHGRHGDRQLLYIFMAVALLMVLIACINYMNLATARSIERAKEVGIRKVVGSHRSQLIKQFIVEAISLSLLALILSICLVELTLPFFNQLSDKQLTINYVNQPLMILSLLGFAILIGLFSGCYPAFVLSAFKPVSVLKGKFARSRKGVNTRRSLVVFQFSVSIVMIISTWGMYEQMQYVRQKNLGFDQDQLYKIAFYYLKDGKKFHTIRQQLLQFPGITKVTNTSLRMEGTRDEISSTEEVILENGRRTRSEISYYLITPDFFEVMGIPIIQGRNLDTNLVSDYTKSIIVNEAFVRKYNWKNPLGKQVGNARVVGVMKDFHTKSMYQSIEPFVMRLGEKYLDTFGFKRYFFMRLHPKNIDQSIAHIKKVWSEYNLKTQFHGQFLDQQFARTYEIDRRRGQIFLIFSLLTIFIAELGLFGLASFNALQRTKEIGIRKVLGASIQQILLLLSRDFVRLVLISSVIAFPIAYYFIDQWLHNFAYRISLHWGVFVGSSLLVLCIALLTISLQSLKVTRVNPTDVLKNE